MKNNDSTLIIIASILMVIMMGVMFFQNRIIDKYKNQLELVDTFIKHDTIYKTITLTDSFPKYINKTIIKTDTVFNQTGDTLKIDLKKKEVSNTVIKNQDTLQYNAWISGRSYDNEDYPIIDSISFKYNEKIIHTTTIIEKPIEHKKKLQLIFTPTITSGYDVMNKQWGAMIGVGIGLTKK